MDQTKVLAEYDEQIRRNAQEDGSGARIERTSSVVRYIGAGAGSWSAVLWSGLDEVSVDAAIAEEVRYFGALGRRFEWKHYAYDRPADLPRRLLAAGFEAEEEEALMVAEVRALDASAATPPGVRLLPVSDEAGVELLVRVHEEVFGVDHSWLRRALLAQLSQARNTMAAVVAMVEDRPVCSARIELHHGTDFASLWGGGTLPGFRRRGIYQALVAHRARIALERGFRYLQVDASPESRPILERLGFIMLTATTPYVYQPPSSERH